MKNGQTRVFTENGIHYAFNSQAFRSRIDSMARERSISKGKITDELADALSVTPDAINNWKYGKNGPADLDTIKRSADFFHVDWTLFVKNADGGNTMAQLTERQKDAVKRIYDILIWFLEEFSNTDGFNDWWLEFKDAGWKNPENAIYDRIAQMERKINLVLNQEYFDLHNHEIYDELCEFASEGLSNVYNGKVSYAYRFEADGEHDPTVWQDYEKAMQHLNEIIERYV